MPADHHSFLPRRRPYDYSSTPLSTFAPAQARTAWPATIVCRVIYPGSCPREMVRGPTYSLLNSVVMKNTFYLNRTIRHAVIMLVNTFFQLKSCFWLMSKPDRYPDEKLQKAVFPACGVSCWRQGIAAKGFWLAGAMAEAQSEILRCAQNDSGRGRARFFAALRMTVGGAERESSLRSE